MTDLGGEAPCWAHLADDLDTRHPDRVVSIDLTQLGGEGDGALWSLPHDGDLDANLIRLLDGQAIRQHVNDEVDVFVIVWAGAGELAVDDRSIALRPGVVVLVPRGSRRTIRADQGGISYLTVHRRRGPLTIGRR